VHVEVGNALEMVAVIALAFAAHVADVIGEGPLMFTAMTRGPRRLAEAMPPRRPSSPGSPVSAESSSAGMPWLTVKQKEYLIRYRRDPLTGRQKSTSLGYTVHRDEEMYAQFVAGRTDLGRRTNDFVRR